MKKKTKKNQTTDCLTVPFSNYLKFSKEYEFIKMAKNGADTLPFFKETWDFIEKNLENDDRYINVLIPFMTTYLHLAMLEEDKKLREKYIWSIWYYTCILPCWKRTRNYVKSTFGVSGII